MSESIRPIIAELEKARDGLVRHFRSRIPYNDRAIEAVQSAIVTVEAKGRKRHGGGYFQGAAWRSQAGEVAAVLAGQAGGSSKVVKEDQITIYAETLAEPVNVILTELAHQVAHGLLTREVANPCQGWHSLGWKNRAWGLGMKAEMDQESRRGFAKMTAEPSLVKVFDRLKIDRAVFDKYRMKVKREDRGSNLRKYVCPCGQIIRVTNPRWPGATCNSCQGSYGFPKNQVLVSEKGRRQYVNINQKGEKVGA